MAFTIPNEAAATYSSQAKIFQTDLDILVAALSATGVISGCAVTTSGAADNKVNVAVGEVMVAGVPAVVTAATVTLSAPNGSNPRLDLVWANSSGTLGKTDGTAAVTPSVPALPASTVVLAFVYSPAAGGNTVSSTWITDKRAIVAMRLNDNSPSTGLLVPTLSSYFVSDYLEAVNGQTIEIADGAAIEVG